MYVTDFAIVDDVIYYGTRSTLVSREDDWDRHFHEEEGFGALSVHDGSQVLPFQPLPESSALIRCDDAKAVQAMAVGCRVVGLLPDLATHRREFPGGPPWS